MEAKYGLLYSAYEISCWRMSFPRFAVTTCAIPLLAFVFCIVYSVLLNFESATFTHCQVYNILPSISSAIGNFTPQKEVWQIAITMQALPRFFIAYLYFQHNSHLLYSRDLWLSYINFALNVIENIALITLSYFTSSKFYAVHEKAFVCFLIGSVFYMIFTCVIQSRAKKQNRVSLKWKKRCLGTNLICILLSTYMFMRHNSLCEPYIYSLFAMFEYIVVLSNMAFHITAFLDFENKDVVFYKYGLDITER
ncbi:unnamed protein product [Brassicogethes aeneus]|uniref:CWH43-like N-terminal domain-containing protein n=1 Tax=Brassicogethes aeneus TaxID=1431903 RepID=A0A9P0BDA8_BRAAE|nr:unnamed protein product [Brassicogethes aeneus]